MNEELVQAALQGDEQAIQQIVMAAMQGDEQATALLEQAQQAAEQGDQNAAQFVQTAMQVAQQMQSQAQAARQGAKIQYLRHLRRECAPGEKLVYFKAGGKVCKKCQKIEEAKCGKKMDKKSCGGKAISKHMAAYKAQVGAKAPELEHEHGHMNPLDKFPKKKVPGKKFPNETNVKELEQLKNKLKKDPNKMPNGYNTRNNSKIVNT